MCCISKSAEEINFANKNSQSEKIRKRKREEINFSSRNGSCKKGEKREKSVSGFDDPT